MVALTFGPVPAAPVELLQQFPATTDRAVMAASKLARMPVGQASDNAAIAVITQEQAAETLGVSIAHGAGFVNVFAREADIFGGRNLVLIGNEVCSLTSLANFPTLLSRVGLSANWRYVVRALQVTVCR